MVKVQPATASDEVRPAPVREYPAGQVVYTEMGELLISKISGETVAVWAAGTWNDVEVVQ